MQTRMAKVSNQSITTLKCIVGLTVVTKKTKIFHFNCKVVVSLIDRKNFNFGSSKFYWQNGSVVDNHLLATVYPKSYSQGKADVNIESTLTQ